ncbi:AMP-binding protein [Acidiferrimicrobium sp. IK]|uniref:AMP-binding protein n=1 Tax=Acidiferrimicrobium sp. IK TaxID=2871700 RepID=UPI0021CB3F97|nr:AMP-binding protein [Acidiferrimicrobium sp. IK]MCU4184197.1 AMP-binding protein [Acidiferrimicrobium sp. IK]
MLAEESVLNATPLHRPASGADLLIRGLSRNPQAAALVIDGRDVTAAEVADQISRYVQAYEAWGLTPGSTTATLSANRPEVLFTIGAGMIAGTRGTPLHPMASLDDHAYILEDAGIETLWYDPDAYEERAMALKERVPTLKRVIALAPTDAAEDLPTAAARFGSRRLRPARSDPGAPYSVAYTGGTTGQPKGVVGTQLSMATMTNIQMAEWDWPDDMRFLCCTPLSHAGAAFFIPTLLRGGSMVVLPHFDPDRVLDAIARHHITATMLVPTMIYVLLGHPSLDQADLRSLQTIYYGAAAMSPTRLAEGIERLGSIFFQYYGQAECPMTITVLRQREHVAEDPDRLASCGRPVPWLDVALLDDAGDPVEPGAPGEICVQGPLVMKEYLNKPEQTAEAFAGGWLHTGDIAKADDLGYLTIVDRKKDMIVTGGFNIFPREVEDVLTTHPGVSAAAVIGVPDDKWGEAVKAVVVRKAGSTVADSELIDLVKIRKGPVAAPKSVDFVEAIPVSALGKPDKKALRAGYWSGAERRVN